MAGAFRMALSRATVTATYPDGRTELIGQKSLVTATVRDGVARAKTGSQYVAEMPATELVRHGSKHFTVVGPDGTTWDVLRDCGCG